MLTDAVARIRAYARENKIRPATLAQKAGLSPNALRDLDNPDWKPRYATLLRLLAVVNGEAVPPKRYRAA